LREVVYEAETETALAEGVKENGKRLEIGERNEGRIAKMENGKSENGGLKADFSVDENSRLTRKRREKIRRILNDGEANTGDKQSDD
jgi:hypothetical protein